MKIFKRLLEFAVAFVFCCCGFSNHVFAEEVPDYRIQVSPASISVDLTPGKVTKTTFRVMNTGTKKFSYKLLTGPYSVIDQEYNSDFGAETNYTYIKDWITFSADGGDLEPGESKEVTASIKVPSDAPSGGQYGVMFARMVDNGEGGLRAEQQVGILVYSSNVDGNTRREGKVTENKVPSFMFAPPIQVSSVVRNDGNIHVNATYTLQVFPLFSDEEVYTNEDNPEVRTILPETSRLNTMSWEGAPQLGIFRVRQTVKFLDESSVVEKIVFICPLWFLFIVLTVIFLAIFWIVSRVRGRGKERSDDRD